MLKNINVIIPASGAGTRFGSEVPKQFIKLQGKTILERTISRFNTLDFINEIAVTVPEGFENEVKAYGFDKVRYIISGKKTRAESVYEAIKKFAPQTFNIQSCTPKPKVSAGNCEAVSWHIKKFAKQSADTILIHDGVRPFVSIETIEAVAHAAIKNGASIAAVPMTDTIKEVNTNHTIKNTPERSKLWRAQTPQGFKFDIIFDAYKKAYDENYLFDSTDDSSLVEKLGVSVSVVSDKYENIKITTPLDFILARELMDTIQ